MPCPSCAMRTTSSGARWKLGDFGPVPANAGHHYVSMAKEAKKKLRRRLGERGVLTWEDQGEWAEERRRGQILKRKIAAEGALEREANRAKTFAKTRRRTQRVGRGSGEDGGSGEEGQEEEWPEDEGWPEAGEPPIIPRWQQQTLGYPEKFRVQNRFSGRPET